MLYFDNAATSFPKAPKVAQTVFDYIQNVGANAGRGSYSSSIEASELLFEVKENIAQLFNIKNEERIVMTSGATESLNTVIMGFLRKGMTVLTSNMEHNSVLRPLNYLAQQQIIDLYKFDITEGLKDFENKLSLNPDLVIVTAASNVTGEIYPITEIGKLVSTQNALFCVDAAQSAGLSPIDVAKSQIDFLCAAGHKGLIGPTGTG
ncbi:MAG: aminotransferase class V-fold PLP-dependent enzyme, partial [Candidatus Cloacimonadota bacterium]|nr:aminotransferase class V-fold PLP-dependent enzyme [Candidatus Cloacimonadota bacterium]